MKKFEIKRVEQVVDYLGMMGDASDNIPGIPGVGDKTAKKFLSLYDSMAGLYENTHVLLYVFYAIAVASVILLLVNQ